MSKAIFYHAGCAVCRSAEQDLLSLISPQRIEVVHLGTDKERIREAAEAGVQSVPALVMPDGNVLHINFGAALEDLS